MTRTFHTLAVIATLLTLCVVVLGAWVRLTDAGLGCPDWPGCYGALLVPQDEADILEANLAFPERPVESGKAWREMIHRYLAGVLGLLVIALAVIAVMNRRNSEQPVGLAVVLVLLVIIQALLGMWTVTLLLKPVVVAAHLLLGMTTLSLLAWLALSSSGWPRPSDAHRFRYPVGAALLVLICQIALGGWTSSNYAALACPDFPTCQTRWWPQMDFAEGFLLWRGTGVDYTGGVLDTAGRVAIHMSHRIGALVTALILGGLAIALVVRPRPPPLRSAGTVLGGLLIVQLALGVTIIWRGLPLSPATAHNGVAALLLLTLTYLCWLSWRAERPTHA